MKATPNREDRAYTPEIIDLNPFPDHNQAAYISLPKAPIPSIS